MLGGTIFKMLRAPRQQKEGKQISKLMQKSRYLVTFFLWGHQLIFWVLFFLLAIIKIMYVIYKAWGKIKDYLKRQREIFTSEIKYFQKKKSMITLNPKSQYYQIYES
jgi:hypothetical protein